MRAKLFISISLLVVALHATKAAPIPKVTFLSGMPPKVSVPPEVLIGENFTFKVTFKNAGSTVGFGPFIDLVFDAGGANLKKLCGTCDGITFVKAEMVGVSGGPVSLKSFPMSAPNCNPAPTTVSLIHPFASSAILPVTVPAGAQLVTIELPFGSFEPTQPEIVVEVTAKVSPLADDNVPLTISARGGFRYGIDALDNAPLGWPILSDVISNPPPNDQQTNSSMWSAQAKTAPRVMILKKEYLGPEDETATGPNYVRQYKITVDIANNQPIANLKVSDLIPGNMQYMDNVKVAIHGVSAAIGLTCLLPPNSDFFLSPTPAGPGGTLGVNFCNPITGTLAHDDITILFNFVIPELDANGKPVLPSDCKPATSVNGIAAEGDWTQTPADVCDGGPLHHIVNKEPAAHTLSDKCIAIQKTVTIAKDTGASGPTPGDVLRYELNFQISDFRTMGDLEISDFLSDGQLLSGPPPTLEVTDKFAPLGIAGPFTLNTDLFVKPDSTTSCQGVKGGTALNFKVSGRMMTLPGAPARYLAGILTGGLASTLPFNFAATGRVVFFATIQDTFAFNHPPGEKFVDKDDPLFNCVTIRGTIRKNSNPPTIPPVTGVTAEDGSQTGLSIVTDTIKKTVYAVKRGTKFICEPAGPVCSNSPNPPQEIRPGDEVTFRIEKTIPSSDAEKLTIEDWLPLPIFNVAGMSFNNSPCTIPGTNSGCLGPNDTMNQLVSPKPLFSTNLPMNSIKFDYGDFNDPANQPRKIDLLFTSTVTNQPFADGLFLTNEAQECEDNTFGVHFCQAAIAQVNLREPKLRVRKGVIATDNPNGQFSQPGTITPTFALALAPPGVTFNLNGIPGALFSGDLSTGLVNSNLSNVDANDWVTFAVVIENQGGHPAYDVVLADAIPKCLTNVTGMTVQWGTGFPLPLTSYTLAPGFTFTTTPSTAVPASAANGSNIIVITFRAQLISKITPGCCDNVAELKHYASQPNGPDFVAAGFTPPFTDAATLCVNPVLTKSVVATSEVHTAPQVSVVPQNALNTPRVTIGEIVRYRLAVLVPEGGQLTNFTVKDALPAGMKFLPGSARLAFVANQAGIAAPFGPAFNVSGNENTLPTLSLTPAQTISAVTVGPNCGDDPTFTIGNIQNNDNDTDLEYVVIEFNALVCNVVGNQEGGLPLSNLFTVSVGGNQIATSNTINVLVAEPTLKITKIVSPSTIVQSGTVVSYTVTVTNTGTAAAFDLQFADTLPPGLTLVAGSLSVAGGCTNPVTNSTPPWVTCSSLPAAGVMTIKYQATANPATCPATLTNQAKVIWTSLPGPKGTMSNATGSGTPGSSGAVDGERDGVTAPPTLNDYFAVAGASLSVICPTCTQPPQGMVAWWPLQETAGTMVADIAGNSPANNGTSMPGAINATGPNSGPAKVDNGFLFCGTPSPRFVKVADKPALNFGTSQSFSIDAWIKTSATPGFQMIVDKHNWPNPTAGYSFYVDNTNKLKFDIGPGAAYTSTVPLTPGNWHHVAVTVDRPKSYVTFYINGTPDQVPGTATINFNASSPGLDLLLGGTHETQLPLACKYLLDEVEIFNVVLAQPDISRIYLAGSAGKCKCLVVTNETIDCNPDGTFSYTFTFTNLSNSNASTVNFSPVGNVTITPGSIPLSPPLPPGGSKTVTVTIGGPGATSGASVCLFVGLTGSAVPPAIGCRVQHCITLPKCSTACCAPPPGHMISWWPLNDHNGDKLVIDIKGGQHGTPNGSATVGNSAPGKVGGSFLFSPSVNVPDAPPLRLGTSNLTIDAWVTRPAGFVVGIVDKLDIAAKKGYAFYIENGSGNLKFVIGNGSALTTYTSTVPVGASTAAVPWHHVAVTVDRTSKVGIFYIDGAVAGSTFTLAVANTVDISSGVPLILGGSRLPWPTNVCVCEFQLDEIEIFDDVVPPAAIKAIFDAGSLGKCLN